MLTIQNQINFKQEATDLLLNQEVEHSKFGKGIITDIEDVAQTTNSRSQECLEIIFSIKFNTETKTFALNERTNHFFTFNPELTAKIDNFLNEANKILVKASYEAAEEERKEAEKRKERIKKQKLEESIQRRKEKELEKVKHFKITRIANDSDANLFYTVGWLAKHTSRISAALPDYLENWFTGRYDINDEDLTVVDSSERTPSGFSEKWNLSMSLRFKVDKNGSIPTIVNEAKSTRSNAINSVDFVGDLIENYNFKFGKKQDLEAIKKAIPEEYIPAFEEGYEE